MPTEYFLTREAAEAFAATKIGAYVAYDRDTGQFKVVWPG